MKLYNDNCEIVLKELIKNNTKVNCIITSPPYNVDLGNNKYNKNPYSLYKDNKEHSEYIKWLVNIFNKCYDLLVDGGRLCINIGDGKNGRIPTHSDLIQNLTKKYLLNSVILWDKKQVGNRTAWGSFKLPSSPSYPTPFEYILIFSKNTYKLQHKGETDLNKEEFIKWAYALWEFVPETKAKKIGHPAPFPEELPKRLIKMNTYIGDIVLDPFMGSGTTGIACKKFNREFIGIELDKIYFEIAKERINNVKL